MSTRASTSLRGSLEVIANMISIPVLAGNTLEPRVNSDFSSKFQIRSVL